MTARRAQVGPRPLQSCGQGLSRRTIQSLIDQDPFATGGPQAPLPADRFERRQGIISDPDFTITKTLQFTVTNEDADARSRTTVITHEYSKGFLSFLGAGPSES